MNDAELARLDKYARKLGACRSETVRYLLESANSKKATTAENTEAIADATAKLAAVGVLNRQLGNNLNQAIRALNKRAKSSDWLSVGEEVMHGVTLDEIAQCLTMLENQNDAIAALLEELRKGE